MQHTKPCKGCPFRKDIKPGELGGSAPKVYVAQAVLDFWLPCHEAVNYRGKASNFEEVSQCAGAAIFRSNAGCPPRNRRLLSLPSDTGTVFASLAAFYAHHSGITLEAAITAGVPHEAIQNTEFMRSAIADEIRDLQKRGRIQLIPT